MPAKNVSTFSIDPSVQSTLKEIAKKDKRTMSSVIEILVTEALAGQSEHAVSFNKMLKATPTVKSK